MDNQSQARILSSLKHLLVPGRIAIISTPDRSALSKGSDQADTAPYPLSARELFELLKRHYSNVIFVGQRPVTMSMTWSLHGWANDQFSFKNREDLFVTPNEIEDFSEPVNLIAICSDTRLTREI